jgi:hypothetical protein
VAVSRLSNIPFLEGGDLVAYPLNGAGRESNNGVFFRAPEA